MAGQQRGEERGGTWCTWCRLGKSKLGAQLLQLGGVKLYIEKHVFAVIYRRAPEPTESRCQAGEAWGALVALDLDNLAASRHFQLGGSPTKRLKLKDGWLV